MLVQNLQSHSAGGAVAPQDHLRVQTTNPVLEGSSGCVSTLQATREMFWLQREGAALVWRAARGSAGFRLESHVQRALGLLQHTPGIWELGKFASNTRFQQELSTIPSHKGLSRGSWNHRVRNRADQDTLKALNLLLKHQGKS